MWFPASSLGQNLPAGGICAHRGYSAGFPENTKTAFAAAIKAGVQMVEFDVRLTKDGKLVVIHNETVDKTTNGKGKVSEMTYKQISQLDAGSWKNKKFKGEKIPTFEEVLDILPDTVWMNIHVKDDSVTAKSVAVVLDKRNQLKNAVLAVDNKSAEIVRKVNKNIKICCMERGDSSEEYVKNAIRIKADFIQLTVRELPNLQPVISALKQHNIIINFYYADDSSMMKLLFDAGVDFVLSNNVSHLISEARKTGILK